MNRECFIITMSNNNSRDTGARCVRKEKKKKKKKNTI